MTTRKPIREGTGQIDLGGESGGGGLVWLVSELVLGGADTITDACFRAGGVSQVASPRRLIGFTPESRQYQPFTLFVCRPVFVDG